MLLAPVCCPDDFLRFGIPRGDNQSTGDLGTGHPKNCDSAHHVLIIILFSKYFGKLFRLRQHGQTYG